MKKPNLLPGPIRRELADKLHSALTRLLDLTSRQLGALDRADHCELSRLTAGKEFWLTSMSETLSTLKSEGWSPGDRPLNFESDCDSTLLECSSLIARLQLMDKYVTRETVSRQQSIGMRLSRMVLKRSAVAKYGQLTSVGRHVDSSL